MKIYRLQVPLIYILAVVVCLMFIQASIANARSNCEALLSGKFDAVSAAYREAIRTPGLYRSGKCHINAIRVFRFLEARFPELNPEDFNVIYIARAETFTMSEVIDSRQSFSVNGRGGSQDWHFHVLLEYKGQIFDLDRSNHPNSIQIEKYFRTFIKPQFANTSGELRGVNKMGAYIVPGDEYLTLPEEIVKSHEFHARMNNFNELVPLESVPEVVRRLRFIDR